jgi:hypothetical protein
MNSVDSKFKNSLDKDPQSDWSQTHTIINEIPKIYKSFCILITIHSSLLPLFS